MITASLRSESDLSLEAWLVERLKGLIFSSSHLGDEWLDCRRPLCVENFVICCYSS